MSENISKIKAVFVWSGGKDSALALHKIQRDPAFEVVYLLTTVNKSYNRVSMHGVRVSLLEQQAQALHLPLQQVLLPENPSMEEYDQLMTNAFTQLKQLGITAAIFGDIFLPDLREYREKQMAAIGIQAVFPLWHIPTTTLIHEFIALEFRAVLVCLNAKYFSKEFAGRAIDSTFLTDLPVGVDPCGENGEYHSFVHDGPNFRHPVPFNFGETVFRTYAASGNTNNDDGANTPGYDNAFWFIDLQ